MKFKLNTKITPGEYAQLRRAGSGWEIVYKDNVVQTLENDISLRPLSRNSYKLLCLENNEVRVIRFADLHRHSDCSLLDGMTKIKDMAERTEYAGALTDHGVMYGFLEYYKAMKKLGKKPILGFEGYMVDNAGNLTRNHVILLAKTKKGVDNLFKLTSEAYDHFSKKPHITWEMLEKYHEDVMCTSACLSGLLSRCIKNRDLDGAQEAVARFSSIFGKEDFYIEVQRHGISEESIVNPALIKLARDNGIKLIATTDSHYPDKEDAYTHEILLCIGTKSTMDDPNHMKYEGSGYHLQTSEEMEELFYDLPEALDNTLEIADKVDITLELGKVNLPKYSIPEQYETPLEYLRALAQEGFVERFAGTEYEKDQVYLDRFKYELDMIEQMGFESYFIIVWDFINYAKQHNIYVGPGRGSAAGSIVAYCLGITDLDPIKYKLFFERFLNPERVSWPDIDTDIEFSRRPEVMAYITQKYGAENVCHIITFGTLAAKQAVQDVARTLGYPASFGISISSMIPKTVGITIAKALEESNDLQTAYKTNPEIKKVVDIAMKLEGNKRHASQHACFTGETLVTTSDGIKQIAEVKRGDMVITHTGCYKPVVNTIITENNETYDVAVYKGQSFTATGNHPILVKRLIYGDPEWITVDKLTEGDYLCIPIIKSETVPIIQGLPTIRHSFWWIVGRYIGDGWTEEYPCFQNGKPGVKRRVIICGGKDQAKGTDSEITAKLEECGFSYCVEFHRSEDIIYINDADPLYFYLQSFGGRYDRKTLTNDILDLPVEYAKVFLNGYMSAVGSYSQSTGEYSCKLTSRELAAGISRIINKVYKIGVDFSTIPAKKEFIKGCRVNTKKTYALYFKPAEQNDFMSFYDSGCIWVAFRKKQKNNKTVPTYNLTVLDDSSYTANGVAVHNCGLVCSPSAVSDFLPTSMELDKETGLRGLTSQVTKDEVEEMSLIKMDLLGLKTLGVIHEIIDRVKETRGLNEVLTQIRSKRSTLRYQDIPLDDRKVYQMLAKGHTGAVFQLESEGMTKLICQMFSDVDALPEERLGECFERLVAAVALYRPGPMDYIPNYIAGLQDHKNIKYLTPELKEILEPTYGVIVYQEQVMQIVQKLAGYTLGRADVVRKAMGKKKQDLLASEEHVFINGNRNEFDSGKDKNYAPGCIANGIPIGVAKEIWSQMSDFAKYAFNRSHAVCYAFLSYITAYMRCYWPEEFYAAMLNAFIENSDKTHIYLYQAAHCGINILPPDINRSQCNFMAEKGSIRFGLSGINGIKSAATDVVKERDERGPYSDVQDLYERLADKGAGLTKKSIEGLVYSGALSEFSSNKMALLRQYELIEAAYKKTAADRELGQISLFSQDELKIGLPEVPPFSEMRSMQLEYSVLGYYLSKHPTEAILKKINPPKTYVALDELASVTNMDRKVTILTIGMINHLKMFYTKSGSMMYTFSLETKFSSVSAVVFPDVLEKFGELLTEASVVAIWADFVYDDRREGMQLVVNKVLDPLAYVETAKTPVVISVINKAEQDEVLAYVEAHGGDTPVELEYNGKRYPLKRGVQYNASAIAYFQNILDKRIS